ncbi:MAG TPA: M56 family metallopeptidase [Candidatus Limnocylindria bacterium]|jgi:beta-lactamase regulating signal transducer with metallopeptidase domain|nr:M56 family metallopeptidase [Candidatus Limnocylindria bacterium]
MSNFANWISPELLRMLGWTLLHFLWQGAGLAALFAVASAVCRSAPARYALAVSALVLMMVSPVITFTCLRTQMNPTVQTGAEGASTWAGTSTQNATAPSGSHAPAAASRTEQPMAMLWLVEAWFLGVLLLSLRTAGGLFLIERMRRKEIKPVGGELYERCVALQRRMGLDRVIQYCECHRLDAPAVLGWFRPVVLLPVRALTGLTEEQIEAVIAHELAHIRRLDCFVNLFQIAAETLLFYHPAVWWVSQRIRAERENCCDDEAISLCGDAVNYARALTLMEEWRRAPVLMMAANRSPLAERVVRLLGWDGAAGRIRVAGLAGSFVCLVGALLAGNAFLGVAHAALGTGVSLKQEQGSSSVIVVRPEPASAKERTAQAAKPKRSAEGKVQTNKEKDQKTSGEDNKKQSYLDAMEAAGFKNLDVDEIIAMKVQGVTPEYIKAMHDLGLQPTPDEFVGMRVQDITAEYIREMRAMESNLSIDQLIEMKVQGITPQYAKELSDMGLKADSDELVGMKVQGVTPDYIREMRATGVSPSVDELIGMKVQGVTPEFIKALQAAGFKDLNCDEVIGAKVQGITAEFIEKARKHGFQNLTLDKLMALKNADIL